MPASTSIIANISTVISNGPAAATTANAIAAAGPIGDYPGNNANLKLKFQSVQTKLALIIAVTDAGDPNLTNLNAILATLTGGGSPSATILTHMAAIIAAGPTAASAALAIAAAGPIVDYAGELVNIQVEFQEALNLANNQISITDSGSDSTNRTLLTNIGLALV